MWKQNIYELETKLLRNIHTKYKSATVLQLTETNEYRSKCPPQEIMIASNKNRIILAQYSLCRKNTQQTTTDFQCSINRETFIGQLLTISSYFNRYICIITLTTNTVL